MVYFNHRVHAEDQILLLEKITMINKILKGEIDYIELGNLNAKDIRHRDYTVCGYITPNNFDDYVLSTNESYSYEFVEYSLN